MNNLIAYCYDFVSYLSLQGILSKYNVSRIILYGSAARGDYRKDSDIDLFIESENPVLEKEMIKIETAFLNSDRMQKWKRIGVKNDFSVIVSSLDSEKWKELRASMRMHAYVLWQRYTEIKGKLKPFALVKWYIGASEPNKRVAISRKINGYVIRNKRYSGIIKSLQAEKIGNASIILPMDRLPMFRKLLSNLKIRYGIYEIFME